MKKKYKNPVVEVLKIRLEESIATASIVSGGSMEKPLIEQEIVQEEIVDWLFDID